MQALQRIGEQEAGRGDVEQVGTAFGQVGQQVHDVEVVEQPVHQRDHRAQHAGFARMSFTMACLPASVGVQSQAPVEDVAGDLGGAAAGGVGVRAQPRQGLDRIDIQCATSMPVAWLTSARLNAFSSAQALLAGSSTAACRSVSRRSSSGYLRTPRRSPRPQLITRQGTRPGPKQVEGADKLPGHQDRIASIPLIWFSSIARPVGGPASFPGDRAVGDQNRRSPGDDRGTGPRQR